MESLDDRNHIKRSDLRRVGYGLALAALLLAGLCLRLANLGAVQHFLGDQGRDYLEVMRWIQDGRWPLLGPRRITGDYTLGPGWFYTLAPALALGGFHPVAGAATLGVLGILTAFLAGEWVRRATGSRTAALAAAAAYALSRLWVYDDRNLWNPHILPLGTVGLAFLIQGIPRRPARNLALSLMLLAILPQWHTTGFLVLLAGAPFVALAFMLSRRRGPSVPRRAWTAWLGAALAVILFLYVPPLLYELRPGPGNLAGYFSRTNIPAIPAATPLGARVLLAFNRLAAGALYHAWPLDSLKVISGHTLLVAGLLAFLILLAGIARARRRLIDFSVLYLILLILGYGVVLTLKGESVQKYFMLAFHPAPLLLAGWAAGTLRRGSRALLPWPAVQRTAGALLIAGSLILTALQFPAAWAVHLRAVPGWGDDFAQTRRVADWIAHDSAGQPYCLLLAKPGDYPAYYLYLVRWMGRPAANSDYMSRTLRRRGLGKNLYVIDAVDPEHSNPLVAREVADPPVRFGAVAVYRIPASRLPAGITRIRLIDDKPGPWSLQYSQ